MSISGVTLSFRFVQTLFCSPLLSKTHTHRHTVLHTHVTHRWPGPGHFLRGWRITGFTILFCSVVLTDLFMDRKRQKHKQLINCVCVCMWVGVCINPGGLLHLQQ